MSDLVYVAVLLAFFAVCTGFVSLCDRIIGPDASSRPDGAGEEDLVGVER